MSVLALIVSLAALTTTACLAVVLNRQQHTIDRLDADMDDLWGVTDTLDLDQETPNE
ncbi:hypothetical protein [Corynebacterium sp.]|uniref:hypothetical protein n=1 Tax=Corynebacterium sp. TaxID=1720 RepID=UPI0025C5733A|nr:hypothetical protein [Corynebacterium sp.]